VRLSDRSDPDACADAIEGRVLAMARSHDLLAEKRWAVDAAARRMSPRWSEAGAPPADAPGEGSFGTQVMDAILRGQLDGEINREWKAEGLSLAITVPLERVQPKDSQSGLGPGFPPARFRVRVSACS
jgi:two-component sensor histidine kinase